MKKLVKHGVKAKPAAQELSSAHLSLLLQTLEGVPDPRPSETVDVHPANASLPVSVASARPGHKASPRNVSTNTSTSREKNNDGRELGKIGGTGDGDITEVHRGRGGGGGTPNSSAKRGLCTGMDQAPSARTNKTKRHSKPRTTDSYKLMLHTYNFRLV